MAGFLKPLLEPVLSRLGLVLYIANLRLRVLFFDRISFEKPNSPKKSLYVSCVGDHGKDYLKKIIERFGHDAFDYLIIVFDDTEFNDDVFSKCRFVREKGLKWKLLKTHVPADLGKQYDYIFLWDDDIDIEDFSAQRFLHIINRNQLDIAQPALKQKSYFSHKITLQDFRYAVGRRTDFVEIMVPVIKGTRWPTLWNMIESDYNFWGWGYDYFLYSRCGFRRIGIVDQESIFHTKAIRGPQPDRSADYDRFLGANRMYKRARKIRLGALK